MLVLERHLKCTYEALFKYNILLLISNASILAYVILNMFIAGRPRKLSATPDLSLRCCHELSRT